MDIVKIVESKNNNYLFAVTFSTAQNNKTLSYQCFKMLVLLHELWKTPYTKRTNILYREIEKDMKKAPGKYSVSLDTFNRALDFIQHESLATVRDINNDNTYNEKHLKNGFYVLSDQFYDEVCSLSVNFVKYVDAIVNIAKFL